MFTRYFVLVGMIESLNVIVHVVVFVAGKAAPAASGTLCA
jgi:hypothetical protein